MLQQYWPDNSALIHDEPKWLIYTLDSAPREADELYRAARANEIGENNEHFPDSDWDEVHSYLKPAKQNFPAPDLQHILDHHFRMLDQLLTQTHQAGGTGEWTWLIYLHGFIVITEESWRENGVTAVHCDEDRGKLKVTKCNNITVERLMSLSSVIEGDDYFDHIRDCFDDGTGNNGPDNQGGPAPVGEWQFAVYCTGPSQASTYKIEYNASRKIPDPRGDRGYPPNEACQYFLSETLQVDSVYEDWPSTYSKLTDDTIVIACREPKICTLHPSLFVHVRGDDFGDLAEIEIVQMVWDHNIERSKEELDKVGRESRITTQKCEATALVATLQQLADGI